MTKHQPRVIRTFDEMIGVCERILALLFYRWIRSW